MVDRVKAVFIRKHCYTISLFLTVFIALLVSFILLERIPTGITDDEMGYILSSRSFFYSAKDVSEQWAPLSLDRPPVKVVSAYGRVPYILFSPFFGNVTLSLFTARFPYALLG